jgi:hypothetical protein
VWKGLRPCASAWAIHPSDQMKYFVSGAHTVTHREAKWGRAP